MSEKPRTLESEIDPTIRRLTRRARALPLLRRAGPKPAWKLDVRLVSGPVMTRLNAKYRGKKYATDVLSFPTPEIFREQGLLGELIVCTPTLRRQARESGHSAEKELEVLLAHGLLHLLGFDHEGSEREARRMRRFEAKLLGRSLGLIDRTHSGKP